MVLAENNVHNGLTQPLNQHHRTKYAGSDIRHDIGNSVLVQLINSECRVTSYSDNWRRHSYVLNAPCIWAFLGQRWAENIRNWEENLDLPRDLVVWNSDGDIPGFRIVLLIRKFCGGRRHLNYLKDGRIRNLQNWSFTWLIHPTDPLFAYPGQRVTDSMQKSPRRPCLCLVSRLKHT
jgi:hypothetical protein